MKLAQFKMKKTIKAKVLAQNGNVKIKLPTQSLGTIAIVYESEARSILLKQFELTLKGDQLKVATIK